MDRCIDRACHFEYKRSSLACRNPPPIRDLPEILQFLSRCWLWCFRDVLNPFGESTDSWGCAHGASYRAIKTWRIWCSADLFPGDICRTGLGRRVVGLMLQWLIRIVSWKYGSDHRLLCI